MFDCVGWIVQATAGRDKGEVFYVVGVEAERSRLLLADGKRRKVHAPKAKQPGHVKPLTDHRDPFPHPVTHALSQGEAVTNRELRRALAAFKEEMRLGKR